MTELERLIKAKIPCKETGIEIKHTFCAICTNVNCGINAYVKDGKVIKIEGDENHPQNKGLLCTKGAANREYLYRKDRVLTPLRRVGTRGEGKFEPITWEAAYREIAERLGTIKKESGAESVAVFSGYSKWYRPFLRRFAFSFGTPNYGTESSTCFTSGYMAWKIATGYAAGPDLANTDLYLGWALNPYYSHHLAIKTLIKRKQSGMKIIIVDPKITPATEKLADLHLRPYPGTDGALALAIANELISRGWTDKDYIKKYVHGFEEYAQYVKGFNSANIEELCGVPCEQVVRAAEMIHESGSMCIKESAAPIAHHRNGLQNYRAIMSLLAITGNYDAKGGQKPSEHTFTHITAGFLTHEEDFFEEVMKKDMPKPVGAERFPLWYHTEREMQSNDLGRQILEGTPYPIRAVFALGMNHRMFAGSDMMLKAIDKLDFFVDVDLFLTDTAKHADIVLPACTTFEREEFKCYSGGYAYYIKPVIAPLGESKPDADIICELANALELDDELLKSGYRNCMRHILRDNKFTIEQLLDEGRPIKVPDFKPFCPGETINAGLRTITGKFELKSELIASHREWGLDALPVYIPPCDKREVESFPMNLSSGVRIPNAIHSRFHDVDWARSLRPAPLAEISIEDAANLGIEKGDRILITTDYGKLSIEASPTATVRKGEVNVYHGYREADSGLILSPNKLDPYSGFPAYNSARCRIEKETLE